MERKNIILELRNKAGLSGGISLGKWRNNTKHRNTETFIEII